MSAFSNFGETPFPDDIKHSQKMRYAGFTIHSEYISMRDGIKLAITYCLPKDLPANQKLPTALFLTRYWRTVQLRFPLNRIFSETYGNRPVTELFTGRGYAIIYVDCRGTGASYGTRPFPFSLVEILDVNDITNWVIQQPWSNGEVVTFGISYVGTMAELTARNKHPALKAIAPLHCLFDAYTEVANPGGIYDNAFMTMWSQLGRGLDQNNSRALRKLSRLTWLLTQGVKPVKSDIDQKMLVEATQEHLGNVYVHEICQNNPYRDDEMRVDDISYAYDIISIFSYQKEIEESSVPYYNLCSWFDSGYSDGVIKRFQTFRNSGIFVLGDWNHGFLSTANTFNPKKKIIPVRSDKEARAKIYHHLIDFFDRCLKGDVPSEKTLYYYTLGEEKWKKTHEWPPRGYKMQRWFSGTNNSLTTKEPTERSGVDNYIVDFNATTGNRNRWWALLALPVDYSNRTEQDKLCLSYTSDPLNKDTEISGHAIVSLYLSSTHEDGAIYVYLEDVDNHGNVTYLTEGQLRFIHRKISSEKPIYLVNIPYHSFKKEDAQPMVPGEITKIEFGLLPISALIRKGHRIRVAISCHDKDTFRRYPVEGNPTISIERNTDYSSFIDLPIITK
ncbi:MAG: CocE/NonD family hydrolase [Candidatus Hodarchaeota archaeon]